MTALQTIKRLLPVARNHAALAPAQARFSPQTILREVHDEVAGHCLATGEQDVARISSMVLAALAVRLQETRSYLTAQASAAADARNLMETIDVPEAVRQESYRGNR